MEAALWTAHTEALKSAETFRVGAAIVRRRSVLSRGRNRNLNSCGLNSIHAEMDAVFKCLTAVKSSSEDLRLVVVRVLKDGLTTACSKPCDACRKALARLGIRKVTYTTGDQAAPVQTLLLL